MYRGVWRVLLVASLIGLAAAVPAASVDVSEGRGMGRNSIQTGEDLMDTIYTDCLRKDSVSCVKYKLFAFVDKMIGSKDSIPLTDGVTVVKTEAAGDGSPRSLDDKNDDIETMFEKRVERFLSSHTLKFDLKGSDVADSISNAGRALSEATDYLGITEKDDSVEESRGKKKKTAKILLPLLLALKLKAAALLPLALGAIALIAGKALVIGKIALVLAAVIGLKKLLSQQKSVTYEIVSHPHHSSSSSGGGGGGHDSWAGGDYSSSGSGGGHGGWARSAPDAQNLAYGAYKPQQ